MLKHIIINEIKKEILETRLQIMLVLFTLIFMAGTITFVKLYKEDTDTYYKDKSVAKAEEKETAEKNFSAYITQKKEFKQSPRVSRFITDAGENLIPNQFTYNGYNIYEFGISKGSRNIFIRPYHELNWGFIAGILVSFTVLLLSFDTITGEKEIRTLALTFSQPISRSTYLFGKYISIILVSFLTIIPGFILSLIILILSNSVNFGGLLYLEIVFFILSTIFLVSAMAALGIICSLLSNTSGEGLLLALSLWLLFVLVIPNITTLVGDYVIPIEPANEVEQRRKDAWEAINDAAPEGSWSANWGDPFYYRNELRARNMMNLMLSDKEIMDDYYQTMFQQYRTLMNISMLSPVSAFGHFNEAISDGGYYRFMKNWDAIHIYQEQLLQFFKGKDAADNASPHWFNPQESLSTTRKPVNYDVIPKYTEKPASLKSRLENGGIFLLMILLYILIGLLGSMWLFKKYDLR